MSAPPLVVQGGAAAFGWSAIVRLGLVQASLGAVVVLTTSTLNRVMVVELMLPALLPGILVALHYAVQMARPRMGYGSDMGRRRTPWILGGMAVLATGGVLASVATAWMASAPTAGIALAVIAFMMIGIGVSASGTSLLVLLAKRVVPERRAAAATTVWLMMILGFAITAGVAGQLLDPYSPERLVAVTAGVATMAMLVTVVCIRGLEGTPAAAFEPQAASSDSATSKPTFREALAQVWSEPVARRFTVFVFVSMLAYSAQDLILEPFAGTVFGYTPGESTSLSGLQHAGVLAGMLLATLAGRGRGGRRFGSLRAWQIGGCLVSAVMLLGIAASAFVGPAWPFRATVFGLGIANGAFSIAAIAAMLRLAGEGRESREGVRMGLWGASQAIAFGVGGLVGTAASDLAHWLLGAPTMAYATVFALEAVLFVVAAVLAARIGNARALADPPPVAVRPGVDHRLPAAIQAR
jgi:MFS transporter, BCD family, chlorophyll transporter